MLGQMCARRFASQNVVSVAVIAAGFLVCGFLVLVNDVCAQDVDQSLRDRLEQAGITPLAPPPDVPSDQFELGKSLFFDKELSGNRDTACASCHHPSTVSGDCRSLPLGTGGDGLGPDREIGDGRNLIPRNSPEVFNRGDSAWTTMFWDSRVSSDGTTLTTPAGANLPPGLTNVLSAQAMFPVTSRDEMRGAAGDTDVYGQHNALADIADDNLPEMWETLMKRLLAIPEYQQMFQQAYPDVPPDQLGFEHAANAIGAFEAEAFAHNDSAWDRYVGGDNNALTESAKRGATLFHGAGNCAACHSGNHFTDQQHHNLGVPQLGPGKDAATGLDPGRALVTASEEDDFKFRTPPLRNSVVTGPWMHNGAYVELEDAIRHHLDAATALTNYDASQLDDLTRPTVVDDPDTLALMISSLDPLIQNPLGLSDQDVDDLMAFMFSLTSPSIDLLPSMIPDEVPSGLPVDRLPAAEIAVLYDPQTGELMLDGSPDFNLTALMLRISEGDGVPAELAFNPDSAAWAGDPEIVLANDLVRQSFIEYRKGTPFVLHGGESLGQMLPAGISADAIGEYLSAVYTAQGSPVLWEADVSLVPEPGSLWLLLGLGQIGLLYFSRFRRTSH